MTAFSAKIDRWFVWLLGPCFALVGCTALLERDFNKAMLVSEVKFGEVKSYTRTLTPSPGRASLILAVRNYRCTPPKDGVLALIVRADGKTLFSERRRLSQLTWSHGQGSCDAYGYVEVTGSKFDLRGNQVVTIEIDVSQISGAGHDGGQVWLIYGDRVPSAKVFAETQ